jgi:hypothetical protein
MQFKCINIDYQDSKDSTVLEKLLMEDELDSFVSQPDEVAVELQRAKSSSMHHNTRSNLLPVSHFPQKGKTGLAELAESSWAPNNRLKSMFWHLGDDSLMIDESQELNRK